MAADGARRVLGERRVKREDRPDALRWIALARSLAAALDLLPQPVILALPGDPPRVWHANAAARGRLAFNPALAMRDGALVAIDSATAAELHHAVGRALAAGPGEPQRLAVAVADARAFALRIQTLEFGASPDLPVSQLLLIEVQERACGEHGLRLLRDQYRLTHKEAECAIGLYAIGSVDRFARCSGKSVHTVRSQLKAAMQKTSTHTQAGLVALVASLLVE